jgi:hypothetical protein
MIRSIANSARLGDGDEQQQQIEEEKSPRRSQPPTSPPDYIRSVANHIWELEIEDPAIADLYVALNNETR